MKMMWLCHGWGWQPPQLPTSILNISKWGWAHWYAVHRHMAAALHSYTHLIWLRFWGSGSLVESTWLTTGSHLKLLPASILDMYKVFGHIDMLSIGIWKQPYLVLPTLLGSDFGDLGHLWSQNIVIMSWLGLRATSNCFPHQYKTYKKCLRILICSPWAYSISLAQLYAPYLAHILGFWVTCGVKMMWSCNGWGWWPPQTASHIHIKPM
jgi:hypothetical protein